MPNVLTTDIVERWGDRGVVELTALIGYYTMVSMTLNAHAIPLPQDMDSEPGLGANVPTSLTRIPPLLET